MTPPVSAPSAREGTLPPPTKAEAIREEKEAAQPRPGTGLTSRYGSSRRVPGFYLTARRKRSSPGGSPERAHTAAEAPGTAHARGLRGFALRLGRATGAGARRRTGCRRVGGGFRNSSFCACVVGGRWRRVRMRRHRVTGGWFLEGSRPPSVAAWWRERVVAAVRAAYRGLFPPWKEPGRSLWG